MLQQQYSSRVTGSASTKALHESSSVARNVLLIPHRRSRVDLEGLASLRSRKQRLASKTTPCSVFPSQAQSPELVLSPNHSELAAESVNPKSWHSQPCSRSGLASGECRPKVQTRSDKCRYVLLGSHGSNSDPKAHRPQP